MAKRKRVSAGSKATERDPLVAALTAKQPGRSQGRTTQELVAQLGLTQAMVLHRLKVLQAEGRLVAFRELRRSLDGIYRPVSCYALRASR